METKSPTQAERAIALLELAPAAAAGRWDSVFADTRPLIRQLLADGNIGPSFDAFVDQSGVKVFWVRVAVTASEQSFSVGWHKDSLPSMGVCIKVTDGSKLHEMHWRPKDAPPHYYHS
jgi:hypothetical protein